MGPNVVLVRIGPSEIVIQNLQLLKELGIGNVLRLVGVYHVKNHRDGDDHRLLLGSVRAGLFTRGHEGGGVLLYVRVSLGIDGIQSHHLNMLLMGSTAALSWSGV